MSLSNIPLGEEAPKKINVVIEIPKGSHNKYEFDEKIGTIKLDRVLYSSVFYPGDYGFLPETLSPDGDTLDTLLVISEPVFPGCVVPARPIGILYMEDEKGEDAKVISVADVDPMLKEVRTITDIAEHFKKQIAEFFKTYKELEKKEVKVKGWGGKEAAFSYIEKSHQNFLEKKKSF